MNVLFLTLVNIGSINDRGIYQDLLRKFRDEGHQVTIVTPVERRKNISTNLRCENNVFLLQVKTLNITKTNVLEKGIGTFLIEYQYLRSIRKYLSNQRFDLVLYSTPPITFSKVIKYIKSRDSAFSYLLLKDIFPQNAVDMKMLKDGGFLHKIFREKEKELYKVSDMIGCMSPANKEFIIENNPEINSDKVEVNPNSISPIILTQDEKEKKRIRLKYKIPLDKKIFVYGGNLGKPQGLDFLLDTIENTLVSEVFILIVGDGTEFPKLQKWFREKQPLNAKLIHRLPKNEYDALLMSCDVGMIFLDKNFKIPNFPSRLLSYLEMEKPILAATDLNTDIGQIIEKNGCGFWVPSGNQKTMQEKIQILLATDLNKMGKRGKELLLKDYTVNTSYSLIINKFSNL